MNRPPLDDILQGWLDAEAAADDARAELALAELFGSLPASGPSPGFAGRVMARAAAEGVLARSVVPAVSWRFQLLVAGALAALTGALVLLPALLAPVLSATGLRRLVVGGVAELIAAVVSRCGQWIAGFLEAAQKAVSLADGLVPHLASPGAAALALLALASAAVALRVLDQLLSRGRTFRHASS